MDDIIDAQVLFRVKCPRCSGKADGIMAPHGARTTYREIYASESAESWVRGAQLRRLLCPHCGLAKDVAVPGTDYELWYRMSFKGHTLWACNEDHISSLIEVLASGRSMTGTPYEALPEWMITDRDKIIAALRKLRSS